MAKFNFGRFIGLAREADTQRPAADVAQARQAASEELQAAQVGIETAEAAYRAALLDPDQEAVIRLSEARTVAGVRRDRAEALLAALDTKLAEVQERDRQAEVVRAIESADAAISEFRAATEFDLPAIAEAARRLIRLEAAAESANHAAAAAIAASGREDLYGIRPHVHAFRALPEQEREYVGSEVIERWINFDGGPVADAYQSQIVEQIDGSGVLRAGGSAHTRHFTRKQRFRLDHYRPATDAVWPERLSATLNVPGLMATDQPGWHPLGSAGAMEVLAALQRLEAQQPRPPADREVKTERTPIGPAYEVTRRRDERPGYPV